MSTLIRTGGTSPRCDTGTVRDEAALGSSACPQDSPRTGNVPSSCLHDGAGGNHTLAWSSSRHDGAWSSSSTIILHTHSSPITMMEA